LSPTGSLLAIHALLWMTGTFFKRQTEIWLAAILAQQVAKRLVRNSWKVAWRSRASKSIAAQSSASNNTRLPVMEFKRRSATSGSL
jgi:hypothetical protein